MDKNDINLLNLYKVISIPYSSFYAPITAFDLFVNKNFIIKKEDFPEEFKHFKKLSNISEAVSFFCQVFNYSLVSVSTSSSGYYTISLKKELVKDIEFLN